MLTYKSIKRLIPLIIVWAVILVPRPAGSQRVRLIESIRLSEAPETVTVKLNGKTPYRVFQLDKKEVVIAFKNVRLSSSLSKARFEKDWIKKIRINRLSDRVVVVSVLTRVDIKGLSSRWVQSQKTLSVRCIPADRPSKKKQRAEKPVQNQRHRLAAKKKVKAPPSPEITEPTYAGLPFNITLSRLNKWKPVRLDSLDQMVIDMETDPCINHAAISNAMDLSRQKAWQKMLDGLNAHILVKSESPKECLEAAYYLRAYAFYKKLDYADEEQQLKAVERFQEVVSYYPKSKYAPYGITALGKLHRKLKNYGEARGYFKVISDTYPTFAGMPEVMLELSRVYIETEKTNLAVSILERLLANHPKGPFVSDAKLELGKAMYEANNFLESQRVLISLMKSDPTKVYESPDFLIYLGNCYYQAGKFVEARDALLRAVNFFPDIPAIPVILSRIADTYRDDNQPEKAQKIHEHVIKNYPQSDGFVISSVRIAEYLKRRAEKENLYRMIITDYPEHPMAQLAMLKLAGLQTKEGEHEKSIETIKAFLVKYPGALKREAIHVMKDAYGTLFQKLMKADNSAGVLAWYEKDKHIVNRINTPEIYTTVGMAYLKGHIYKDAADLLQKAYQLYAKDKRPPELYSNLGISLHESGQSEQALKILNAYTHTYPKHADIGMAYAHIGQIYFEKKKYKKAIRELKTALKKSKKKTLQSTILLSEAAARKEIGDLKTATNRYVKAINMMAALPDQPPERISQAYRDLGETYLKRKAYLKAADALAMSVKFSENEENADLRFILAEAYEKGKAMDRAGEVYQEIIDLGDPFWARLAQEKLRGIQIDNKLEPAASLNG
jgi:TolA-binding protein